LATVTPQAAIPIGGTDQLLNPSQQLQGQEPGQLQLLDGVAGWQLYFWRGQGWSNAQSSADEVAIGDGGVNPSAPPASGASAPAGGASAPAGGASAPPPATAAVRNRSLLPTGVRLQLDLPEGRITRDVLLPPTP
jgi:general secretion pathway protein J